MGPSLLERYNKCIAVGEDLAIIFVVIVGRGRSLFLERESCKVFVFTLSYFQECNC